MSINKDAIRLFFAMTHLEGWKILGFALRGGGAPSGLMRKKCCNSSTAARLGASIG